MARKRTMKFVSRRAVSSVSLLRRVKRPQDVAFPVVFDDGAKAALMAMDAFEPRLIVDIELPISAIFSVGCWADIGPRIVEGVPVVVIKERWRIEAEHHLEDHSMGSVLLVVDHDLDATWASGSGYLAVPPKKAAADRVIDQQFEKPRLRWKGSGAHRQIIAWRWGAVHD